MCGRYALRKTGDLPALFEISEVRLPPRFNIAPSQKAPVVRIDSRSQRRLDLLKWGLIPSWAKDPSIGYRMINARSETVQSKPSFRGAFKGRRCLIPCDGFFEWEKTSGGGKQPYFFAMEGDSAFALAGLWEQFRGGGELIETFTIVTCEANDLVGRIHERMPAILPKSSFEPWLDPKCRSEDLLALLSPYPSSEMRSYPVSSVVNRPANDGPECVTPIVLDS